MSRYLPAFLLVVASPVVLAQSPPDEKAMQLSVEELRSSIGRWEVTTELLNEDGTVARSAAGTYDFSWIVPDRVVTGKSETPELKQAAGILFYVNETKQTIEMVSVGGDGNLWIMAGPLGGNQRLSQEFKRPAGDSSRLRFTRYNVSPTAFESKMEITNDGGKTWRPGNHQLFRRVADSVP